MNHNLRPEYYKTKQFTVKLQFTHKIKSLKKVIYKN